ncbi:hypothetical protein DY000_02007747 [Brassica cretica]|uniref:DUF641 domain-containing protein n=1 Tax=Brassica cretica TaxID=69181 RepID=A0ABQ7BTY8_BRACR|nr:hypothetical protein DY000_02007747 [Brassica cretica]
MSRESINIRHASETFALLAHCYPNFEESFAVDTELPEMKSDEYDEDYHREKDIKCCGLDMDERGFHHTLFASAMSTSSDSNIKPSIDDHPTPNLEKANGRILNISKDDIAEIISMNGCSNFFIPKNRSEALPSIDNAEAPSIDGHFESRRSTLHPNRKSTPRWEKTEASIPTGDYSIGSWAGQKSFAVDTELPEMKSDEYDEDYHREKDIEYCGLAMNDRGFLHTSFASATSTSSDSNIKPSIDDHPTPNLEIRGFTIDRRCRSTIDQRSLRIQMKHTSSKQEEYTSLEKTEASIPTVPEQNSYNKIEINELVAEIYIAIRTSDDYLSNRLDDVYNPFYNIGAGRSKSTTAHAQASIDAHIRASINARLTSFKDRLQSFTYRLDGVYYPLRDSVDFLTTRLDALQHEMDMIQRQLDSQPEPSPSIDRRTRPSINSDFAALRSKPVTKKSLHDKLDEISFSQGFLKEDVYQEPKDIS